MNNQMYSDSIVSPHDALIAVMIGASMSDETLQTSELLTIERLVKHLPAFNNYDVSRIKSVANLVFQLLQDEDGLDKLFEVIRGALPPEYVETAYAFACDVAAADGRLRQTELRFLQEARDELDIDRLTAAAIEKAAGARYATIL